MAKIINLNEEKKEKTYIVYLSNQENEYDTHQLEELVLLAKSALLDVKDTLVVNVREINPATYIGVGKVEEIKTKVDVLGIDVVIFSQSLTGSQLRNLTDAFGVKVIDRNMLILQIFADRAKSSEGKLQVSLAQLEYNKSRLSALSGSAGKFGFGGVGMRGPGESKLELDRRKVEEEIVKKKKELKDVEKNRETTKKQRKRNGEKLVSLVGYSNAGKSTLLNAITKADAYADDRLFATLDVLSKKVWDNGVQYILSDTVGFISNLPHQLMNAFSATLEELRDADLILIVLDASDNNKYEQLKIVENEMEKQGVEKSKAILVYNKMDKLSDEEKSSLETFGYETCYIQAKNKVNILELKAMIRERLSTY